MDGRAVTVENVMNIKTRSALPLTLILVRHGHVEGISPERFRGRSDLPLTTLGLKQCKETARFIYSKWKADQIYSSPLQRCVETAKIIAQPQKLEVKSLDQLIDIDYGNWQGETIEHVQSVNPSLYKKWLRHPQLTVFADGETLADVQARVVRALDQICNTHSNGTVIAVGHDSTIKLLLALLLNMPLSSYWQMQQDPCAVNVVRFFDDECKVECINTTAHLE
jgi:broad specificity phosphatase PhoE